MTEHYFTENPQSDIKEKQFIYTVKGVTLSFTSVSGVFAFGQKIDKVSELLISNFKPSGNQILDLGCGYGTIGLFIKSIFTNQLIDLVDINKRALDYANINSKKNKLDVNIFQSNLYSNITATNYDDIISNPPFAAGKKLNTELITDSIKYLKPNGALWLVAFHNKGGSSLKEIMLSTFGNVEDVVKSGGIRVYKSVKSF